MEKMPHTAEGSRANSVDGEPGRHRLESRILPHPVEHGIHLEPREPGRTLPVRLVEQPEPPPVLAQREVHEGEGVASANHGWSEKLRLALIPTGYDNTVIAIRVP